MALGGLVVRLALEYAQYVKGLDKSSQEALSFGKNVQDAMDKAKRATGDFVGGVVTGIAGAVASYQSIQAVITGVSNAINRLDALNDMSQRIGIATGTLQELAYAGQFADVSLETIATGAKKLSQSMLEAATGGKEQTAMFKAMGVQVKSADGTLRDITDVLGDVSEVFAGMDDGPLKTALAMKVFGKSGADLIPMLNGGKESLEKFRLEAEKFGLVVGQDVIEASGAFNDNIDRMGKVIEGTFNALAQGTLPVLVAFSDAMVQAATDTESLNQEAQELARNGTLTEWAKGVAIGITYIMDAAEGTGRVIKGLAQLFGGLMAAATANIGALSSAFAKFQTGDFTGAFNALKSGVTGLGTIVSSVGEDLSKTFGDQLMGAKIRDRIKDMKGFSASVSEVGTKAKPSKALLDALTDPKGPGDAAKAMEKWVEELTKYQNELDASAKQTEKLSKGEAILAQILANNTKEVKSLTEADRQRLEVMLQSIIASEKRNAQQERERKANEDAAKAYQQEVKDLTKAAEAAEEQARAELESVAVFGMSKAAIMERNAARLDEQATMVEGQAIKRLDRDLDEQAYDLAMRQARAYRERADAMRQGAGQERAEEARKAAEDQAKAAHAEWVKWNDQIGQSLADALMEGGKSARDYLKGLFRNLVLQPVIRAIMGPVSGGLATFASGGVSAGSFVGGTSGAGALGDLANSYSALSKAYEYYTGTGTGTLSGNVGSIYAQAWDTFATSSYGQSLGYSALVEDAAGNIYLSQTASGTAAGGTVGTLGAYAGYAALGQLAGRGISGGYSAIGGNSGSAAVNIGTVIGAIWGPIGSAIGGAIGGLVNRAFGRKAPEVEERGITGSFSGGDFTGRGYTDVLEEGGWFRSDKRYTLFDDLNADINKALDAGAEAILVMAKKYTEVLGLPAELMSTVTDEFRIAITDDADENAQAVSGALQKYAEALFGAFEEQLEPFRLAGEEISKTIERVGSTLSSVNSSLAQLGVVKLDQSLTGATAALDLADQVGGVDAFNQLAQQFYGAFYSESEKTMDLVGRLSNAFGELGIQMPSLTNGAEEAKAAYRDLLRGQDLSTEAGREQFAILLQLAGAFDAAAQAADAMAEAEANRQEQIASVTYDLELEMLQALGKDTEALALQRAQELAALREVEVATGVAAGTFTDMKEAIYEVVDAAAEAAKTLSVFDGLQSIAADFMSGIDLFRYHADRISLTLQEAGLFFTNDQIINATKEDFLALWRSLDDDGRIALQNVYDDWKELQQLMADAEIAELIAGIASSADELMAAYDEINPAADTLVQSWRKNKTAMEELQGALDELSGTQAKSALDTLRETIASRDALLGVIGQNEDSIFNLSAGQGGLAGVEMLRRREAELWNEFASTGSPEVAQALTRITLQRIEAEGKLQAEGLQGLYDARYQQELEVFNLQKAQHDAAKDAAQEQIDAANRMVELAKGIPEFLGGLRAGSLSNLSYSGRLGQQQALFERSLETGIDPQGQLTAYLSQAQQIYGGATAEYSAIFESALAKYEAAITEAAANAPADIALAEAQLAELEAMTPRLETAIVDTSAEQILALEGLNVLFDGKVSELNDSIGSQTAVLQEQLEVMKETNANQEAQITQAAEAYMQIMERLNRLVQVQVESAGANSLDEVLSR